MRIQLLAVAVAAVSVGACTQGGQAPTEPSGISVPVFLESAQHADTPHGIGTHLTGAEEVPPRETRGQGQAIFRISEDGTELTYKLIVANILNVTQAHIHLGPAGGTGGIVAWLYPSAPPLQLIPGRTQGVLGEGVITSASLVGALAGQPLSALIDAILDGGTYVNVHTLQFPPGEIRGQID
jgi:CHRD domain